MSRQFKSYVVDMGNRTGHLAVSGLKVKAYNKANEKILVVLSDIRN